MNTMLGWRECAATDRADQRTAVRCRRGVDRCVVRWAWVVRVLTLDSDPRERTGQSIYLRREGDAWIIQSLGMYVVD